MMVLVLMLASSRVAPNASNKGLFCLRGGWEKATAGAFLWARGGTGGCPCVTHDRGSGCVSPPSPYLDFGLEIGLTERATD